MPREIDLKPHPPRDPMDPEILQRIDKLVHTVVGTGQENRDLAREMIVTSLKSVKSRLGRGDMKLLNRALRELRYAFKVLGQFQHRRKVTIFGSARARPSDPIYRQTLAFARQLRRRGYMIVTGAGPGIMQAGNQGAGQEHSIGINIQLPFEQRPNPFVDSSRQYLQCRYFFTRKLLLAKEADAAVFFPGGFGTQDEAFELLTLIQTGKAEMIPIIFVDVPRGRYWKDWLAYIRKHLLRGNKISPEDMHLFTLTNSARHACGTVLRFYRNYHSMRYIDKWLVLRIQRSPDPASLKRLTRAFSDIIVKGGLASTRAFPEEWDDEHTVHLPRIVFHFDRIHFGRLRQFIDRLNGF